MSLNVCIFGVSGYTGSKLLYFLNRHKNINIHGIFGKTTKGQNLRNLFPKMKNLPNILISDYLEFNFSNTDLIFSCLPHGEFQQEIIFNLDDKIPIIDLSGDFRLNDILEYEYFYKTKHKSKKKFNRFVYGLSEIYKNEIIKSKFVANPGCYPTSVLIPLLPLLKKKIIDKDHIVIDSKSGVSGAGKKPKNENLLSELSENFFSYNIFEHKHYPEIKQELGKFSKNISFTFIPNLLPVFSGIQSTIYLSKNNLDQSDVLNALQSFYKKEPFIKFFKNEEIPKLSDVRGTNNVALKVFTDYAQKKIIIISCIDNLIKGAAGQAIQNMNLMFDFNETQALI